MAETSAKPGPSEKRRQRYHEVFKSIPKTEALKYSCPCVLKDRSRYYQGRLYIGDLHICFFSKTFFSKRSTVIGLRDVLAIERQTKMLINQCLVIVTYEKRYVFHGLTSRDEAHAAALSAWRRCTANPPEITSVFQVGDCTSALEEEKEEEAFEERVFPIPIEQVVQLILKNAWTKEFYETLSDQEVRIQRHLNNRKITFSNELVEEVYSPGKDKLLITYYSRGPVCNIEIHPYSRTETAITISEKYSYTKDHYFKYMEYLIEKAANEDRKPIVFLWIYAALLAWHIVFLVGKTYASSRT